MVKVTVTPATGFPFASVTVTTNGEPSLEPTVPVAPSPDVDASCVGVPAPLPVVPPPPDVEPPPEVEPPPDVVPPPEEEPPPDDEPPPVAPVPDDPGEPETVVVPAPLPDPEPFVPVVCETSVGPPLVPPFGAVPAVLVELSKCPWPPPHPMANETRNNIVDAATALSPIPPPSGEPPS
ncbi:MAG TPA: hypothetical protein VFF73_15935 [Planctomycetota bacterium]|nr:hypothetical protein [Planctomycetota bacterium]